MQQREPAGIDYDVLIAGAGPVGLFLACELALAGYSVLVLEQALHPESPFKHLPFGMRGLSTQTIEALDRRALLGDLVVPHHAAGSPTTEAPARQQAGHFAGIAFEAGNVDSTQWPYRLPSSTPTSMLAEMALLESVLLGRAVALGVTIVRGEAVIHVDQTADSVTVQSGYGAHRARWLVGCDGARSQVRKAGGFDFAGTEPAFTGYSVQLSLADPGQLGSGRILTDTGMYFQSQPGFLVMLAFDGGAAHQAGHRTLDHVQAVLRHVSGAQVTILALHRVATWTDRARQATTYRHARVLLAGDAAHIHAPLGGQGLNLGLGDAMNLGWKLAATVHGIAPPGLLDSYHTERHPVGVQVLDWSRAQVAIMRPDAHARALNAIVRDLMQTRDGATYFAARVWGVATHYPSANTHPLVGHSVPNFAWEDGTTMGTRLQTGQALLVDFTQHAALQAVAEQFAGLGYVAGPALHQCGLQALLVRPDGVVAWASSEVPDRAALRIAAATWFTGPPGEASD